MTTAVAEPQAEVRIDDETDDQTPLSDRAVLVRLAIGNWNERAVDNEITRQVNEGNNASMDAGRYVKRLFPKQVTLEVRNLGHQARQAHNGLTMPWDDHGTRILPIQAYSRYNEQIDRIIDQRIDARNRLVRDYDAHLREARKFRGDLFRDADYPEPEELARAITMEKEFMPVPEGRHLIAHLPESERRRIQREIEQRISERISNAVHDLYRRLHAIVSQASDRMAPDEDGRDKTFRNTLIAKLKEMPDTVRVLNITNDPELDRMCRILSEAVHDVQPDQIRSNTKEFDPDKRARLKSTIQDMEILLAGYVT